MALSLSDLKRVKAEAAPRCLIYGPPGIGKTTLAAEFPDAVFIQIEDGTPGALELTSFGVVNDFNSVMSALGSLYTEPHEFKTLVVDSVTELQRLVFAETCRRGDEKGNEKKNIEDFGYGKGYVLAQRVWQDFLEGINALRKDRKMNIVLIAHSAVERFDDPETVSYDRYEIDLHKYSVGAIERDMDCILLLKKDVTVNKEKQGFNNERAIGGGGDTVWINTRGRPAFIAKNRYEMPEKILFTRGQGYAELSKYFPKPQAAVA